MADNKKQNKDRDNYLVNKIMEKHISKINYDSEIIFRKKRKEISIDVPNLGTIKHKWTLTKEEEKLLFLNEFDYVNFEFSPKLKKVVGFSLTKKLTPKEVEENGLRDRLSTSAEHSNSSEWELRARSNSGEKERIRTVCSYDGNENLAPQKNRYIEITHEIELLLHRLVNEFSRVYLEKIEKYGAVNIKYLPNDVEIIVLEEKGMNNKYIIKINGKEYSDVDDYKTYYSGGLFGGTGWDQDCDFLNLKIGDEWMYFYKGEHYKTDVIKMQPLRTINNKVKNYFVKSGNNHKKIIVDNNGKELGSFKDVSASAKGGHIYFYNDEEKGYFTKDGKLLYLKGEYLNKIGDKYYAVNEDSSYRSKVKYIIDEKGNQVHKKIENVDKVEFHDSDIYEVKSNEVWKFVWKGKEILKRDGYLYTRKSKRDGYLYFFSGGKVTFINLNDGSFVNYKISNRYHEDGYYQGLHLFTNNYASKNEFSAIVLDGEKIIFQEESRVISTKKGFLINRESKWFVTKDFETFKKIDISKF